MVSKHLLVCTIAALVAMTPAVSFAADAKGTDRQALCSAARDQARKDAGTKRQLSECTCTQPGAAFMLRCARS